MATPSRAQIVADPTLPIPSLPSQTGTTVTITGGTTFGNNLFHSFREFSVPTGGIAWFNQPPGIQTILTRVTGNLPSTIDGILRANGTANVFLLNPNGIFLGANARLEIGGSFLATTATSYRFSDGSEFSASNPQAPPLLAVNVPLGLQFGATPGQIVQQSPNLAVLPGRTLALVGGDVLLPGGSLIAPSGRVEIGSVQSAQFVAIAPTVSGFTLSYPGIQTFGTIQLSGNADINTSGDPGGAIQIQGRSLQMLDNARIASLNLGGQNGGNITINTTDSLEILGAGNYSQLVQALATGTLDLSNIRSIIATATIGTGAAGNLNVNTRQLSLQNGAYIASFTAGAGATGSLTVNATEAVNLNQGVLSTVTAVGSGGDSNAVTVNTNRLTMRENSFISTATFGTGASGKLVINAAERVELVGATPIPVLLPNDQRGIVTSIATSNILGDRVGDLELNVGQLFLTDGAVIAAENVNRGDGGNLTIRASERIDLIGRTPLTTIPTAINASGGGSGGNVTIITPSLVAQDGAGINVRSQGSGVGGNLVLTANSVQFRNQAFLAANSSLGTGGNIQIDSRSLLVTNGSTVSAATGGQGSAGNIQIRSQDAVTVSGNGSGFFTTTNAATGQGGDISITTDRLTVNNFAQLNASTTGDRGGNISVNSRIFTVASGGRLRTTTFGPGQAGDIAVNASEQAIIEGTGIANPTVTLLRDTVTTGNLIFLPPIIEPPNPPQGAYLLVLRPEGNIRIPASAIFQLSENQTGLFASSYWSGAGGSIFLNAPQIHITNEALISVSSWATGNGGKLRLSGNRLTSENSLLLSSSTAGNGGNIAIAVNDLSLDRSALIASTARGTGATIHLKVRDTMFLRHGSQITARAFETGNGGNIQINAGFIIAHPTENSDITARAFLGQGGNIQINTQGIYGLTFRPQPTPLSDITASSQFGVDGIVTINAPTADPTQGVMELPAELLNATNQITQTCSPRSSGNRFVLTGRGGMPPTPAEIVNASSGWQDGSLTTQATVPPKALPIASTQTLELASSQTPIEATSWVRDADGTVSLVIAPTPVHQPQYADQSACVPKQLMSHD